MKEITISNSPLTNTIYAGTLLKGGRNWGANKQDVTIEALISVVDHCLTHAERNNGEKVKLTDGIHKYIIHTEKVTLKK